MSPDMEGRCHADLERHVLASMSFFRLSGRLEQFEGKQDKLLILLFSKEVTFPFRCQRCKLTFCVHCVGHVGGGLLCDGCNVRVSRSITRRVNDLLWSLRWKVRSMFGRS